MPRTYAIARWISLRVLGICLVGHFASVLPQVRGLVGSTGITPLAELMAVRTHGFELGRLLQVPSLFWLSTTDAFVVALLWLGLVAGIAVTAGVGARAACTLAFVINLSFRTLEPSPFAWFNWPFDDMLTEASFLGVFLAPRGWWSSPSGRSGSRFGDSPPTQVRAALFRFRFATPEERARGEYWHREFLSVHATSR